MLTRRRSCFPTLKNGTFLAGMLTLMPVFGFRPLRAPRRRIRKLPKPRSSTFSPLVKASVIFLKIVLTMVSLSFFVRFATFASSSIRSAFVMGGVRENDQDTNSVDVMGAGVKGS